MHAAYYTKEELPHALREAREMAPEGLRIGYACVGQHYLLHASGEDGEWHLIVGDVFTTVQLVFDRPTATRGEGMTDREFIDSIDAEAFAQKVKELTGEQDTKVAGQWDTDVDGDAWCSYYVNNRWMGHAMITRAGDVSICELS